LVVLCLFVILCKSFSLQVIEYDKWSEKARAQTESTLDVPAYRGSIYDRKGRLLSYSVPQRSLFAEGNQFENDPELAARLTRVLGEPQKSLEKKLGTGRSFIWVKRHLSDQQALAIESIKPKGLHLVDEYKRFYPFRQVGGQVLGFVGLDGTGLEGVEKFFDSILKHSPFAVGQFRDGIKKCLWMEPSPPPEPSESLGVKLTLDAFIQYVSECELEKAAIKYHARAAEIVVMDAETSEVLAMANWPFFDPNLDGKKSADAWRNRIITDSFEPGSTFKVFLMSGAINEGIVKERDKIFCENGKFALARHIVNDVHPYGWLTMSEVIQHSSNIASAKIALQLGGERYYRTIQGFGFGSPTGISLPGEMKGLVRNYRKWKPIDLAVTGFGQSIGVTALQLNTAIATIANGGSYIQPTIAQVILDSNGQVVRPAESPVSPRRVIKAGTAEIIRKMMRSVTEEGGTGVNAAPQGYSAAGKTGTAQILDRATGRYASGKYTALFTGFVPAEKPRLVMTVVVHEPHGAIYGGVVAAPVFREVAAKVLPYLGVMPADLPLPLDSKLKTVSVKASGARQPAGVGPISCNVNSVKGTGKSVTKTSGVKSTGTASAPVKTPAKASSKVKNNRTVLAEEISLKAENGVRRPSNLN
jgi:cell division protein FtsI (penicillin-binding protein 3)